MFRSTFTEGEKAWFNYESYPLLDIYKSLQKRIIDSYGPSQYIVELYSKKVKRRIYPITEDYLEKNQEVAKQNVALLKNAMELWRTAIRTSDAILPILYHYSWHCFNSFFLYSFFRWEPQHSGSHGIFINEWSENVLDIQIKFLEDGIFQRLVDSLTLLGVPLAFSSVIPVFEGDQLVFDINRHYLPSSSKSLTVKKLLCFEPIQYGNELMSHKDKLIYCPHLGNFENSITFPNIALKKYIIIFIASSIARYRPVFWNSIITGETYERSQFATNYRSSLVNYTLDSEEGTLNQISRLLGYMSNRNKITLINYSKLLKE